MVEGQEVAGAAVLSDASVPVDVAIEAPAAGSEGGSPREGGGGRMGGYRKKFRPDKPYTEREKFNHGRGWGAPWELPDEELEHIAELVERLSDPERADEAVRQIRAENMVGVLLQILTGVGLYMGHYGVMKKRDPGAATVQPLINDIAFPAIRLLRDQLEHLGVRRASLGRPPKEAVGGEGEEIDTDELVRRAAEENE